MLFLTTWKRYYLVAVHIYSPLGKGCLMSLLLCLYPGVLNGFCLSRKTIPQCVLGVNPRGSKIINVKCLIVANRHPHQCNRARAFKYTNCKARLSCNDRCDLRRQFPFWKNSLSQRGTCSKSIKTFIWTLEKNWSKRSIESWTWRTLIWSKTGITHNFFHRHFGKTAQT